MSDPFHERLLFASNKFSCRAQRGETLMHKMKKHSDGRMFRVLHTPSASAEDSINFFAENIQEGDIVVAVGGDGMANIALNALIRAGKDETSLAILPAGGGNDGSRSLSTKPGRAARILKTGARVAANSMRLTVKNGSAVFERNALSYIGVGASGVISSRINKDPVRQIRSVPGVFGAFLRKSADFAVAADSLFFKPSHPVRIERGQELHKAQEIMYVNGSSVGGALRTGQSLTEPFITRAELPVPVLSRACSLGAIVGRSVLRKPIDGENIQQDSFTILNQHYIQFDGEELFVPAESQVSIAVQQESVEVWTDLRGSLNYA